jgi:hypothetical protein
MIAEIAAATLMTWTMVQTPPSDDPLKSALNYHAYLDKYVERFEAKEVRQQERREARQQQALEERTEAAESSARSTRTPASTGGLPSLLALIRSNESGGNYAAYNPTGCEGYGCGGAYQMHARYASIWGEQAGYSGLSSNAATWSPSTQDAVALYLYYSTNPDGAHWCNWTDYC